MLDLRESDERDGLAPVAEALAGSTVRRLARASGGGRNSRVYRVETDRGTFALKVYPQDPGDERPRLATEFAALRLLDGCSAIPKALAAAAQHGCALYEWIDGTPVGAHGAAEIAALLAFLRFTHARRAAAGAFGVASEACLSEAELVAQIERRRVRLGAVNDARLARWLHEYDGVAARVMPPSPSAAALDPALRTLSPSDAGFHNALRRPGGELVFLDLEYFGWDDPVKLVADILWHPGMTLSPEQRAQFLAGAADSYADDIAFNVRLSSRYALFGLRWSLIVLNEFLDPVWERRVAAGERRSRQHVQDEQLAKASRLVAAAARPFEEIAIHGH